MEISKTTTTGTWEVRNGADYLLGWVVMTPSGNWHSVDYHGLDCLDGWQKGFAQKSAAAARDYVMAEWEVLDRLQGKPTKEAACLDWLDLLTSDNTTRVPRSTATRPTTVDEVAELLTPMGWANPEDPHQR